MLLVVGKVRLPAEAIEAVRPAMAALIEATRAEEGCIDFAYSIDVLDAQVLRIIERWQDRAALDAHLRAPHTQQWNAVLAKIDMTDGELAVIDGQALQLAL